MKVTAWTESTPPAPAIGEYYRDLLDQSGFEASTKLLSDQVYFQAVGSRKRKAQTGFTNWLQDVPHRPTSSAH
jgi:hypothetical protein